MTIVYTCSIGVIKSNIVRRKMVSIIDFQGVNFVNVYNEYFLPL